MKRNLASLVLVISFLIVGLAGSGCATYKNVTLNCKPVTDYPAGARLDLKVALVLQNEFAGGVVFERPPESVYPGMRFSAPKSLEGSAEALMRALFSDVQIIQGPAVITPATCNATIRPHIASVEEVATLKGGLTLFLEWTVARPNGELVWKKTIKGEGVGSQSEKTLFQRALDDVFHRSYDQISTSPEIRALAQQRPAGAIKAAN